MQVIGGLGHHQELLHKSRLFAYMYCCHLIFLLLAFVHALYFPSLFSPLFSLLPNLPTVFAADSGELCG